MSGQTISTYANTATATPTKLAATPKGLAATSDVSWSKGHTRLRAVMEQINNYFSPVIPRESGNKLFFWLTG